MTNWVPLPGTLFWAVDAVGALSLEEVLWRPGYSSCSTAPRSSTSRRSATRQR
jgi:hypothetical protein